MDSPPALIELFRELEFRSLVSRLTATEQGQQGESVRVAPPALKKEHVEVKSLVEEEREGSIQYTIVTNQEKLDELIQTLEKATVFCLDTETTGLSVVEDTPVGMSLATAEKQGFYVPLVEQNGFEEWGAFSAIKDLVLQKIQKVLEDPSKTKIGHNLKFDIQMLNNIGLRVKGPFVDTMICSYVLEPNSRDHSLDTCTLKYLDYKKIPLSSLINLKQADGAKSIQNVPLKDLARYAMEDADLTFRLYKHLWPKVEEAGLTTLLREIEMPLVPILAGMEQTGVFVDAEYLGVLSVKLDAMSKTYEKKIYELAGETFNINSPKQLQVILYEKLKIPEALGITRIKKTQTGYSTDVSVLEKLSGHPLPEAILDYRSVMKLKSVYVEALPQLISAKSHRVHTSFHQTGTATGRLSSSDPNLQNIPIRTSLGREIRRAFRAEVKDRVIISADYSQIELRLLSHLAEDEALIEAFKKGLDIHRATAARIFGLHPDFVSDTLRSRAKAINFGIIYGMGPQRLARDTGVSMGEARDFIDKYFAGYPGVKKYIDKAIETAKEMGFSTTIVGRRRPIPELNSRNRQELASAENIAVNSPVQGSAADLIKQAMIVIDKVFREQGLRAKMILQVHDELVFECPRSEQNKVVELVKHSMEGAMTLSVPLVVDIGVGENWLEAH